MTKRQLLKFLEMKRDIVMKQEVDAYRKRNKELRDQAIADAGLPDVAAQIEEHLNAALSIWNRWADILQEDKGIRYQKYCYPFPQAMSVYTASQGDTLKNLCDGTLEVETADMLLLQKEHNARLDNIYTAYKNVIAVAESTTNSKEIIPYLKELGFDLGELPPNPKTKVTALAVTVNPAYLFPREKPAA